MAEWTHRICGDCWLRLRFEYLPDGGIAFKPPVMVKGAPSGLCCFCPNMSQLGIFVRHDPKDTELTCKGEHPE